MFDLVSTLQPHLIAGGVEIVAQGNTVTTSASRWDRYLGMTAAMTQVPVPTATRGVEKALDTNPHLNNIYYGIRYGLSWGESSLKSLKQISSHPESFLSPIKKIEGFKYGYQIEELVRDYIKDGGFGYNFQNDLRIAAGETFGEFIGGAVGSFAGPFGTFVGSAFGAFYMEMQIRRNIYENYIYDIQPNNMNWDGYYNLFMNIY